MNDRSEQLRKWLADLMQTYGGNAKVARMLAAMNVLRDNEKEVIILGIFQDMSYSEMELMTGTEAKQLRSRMVDALERVAAIIGLEKEN